MPQTHIVTTYNYDELEPKAQEKALEKLYDINVDHEWWEYLYDDAKQVGIDIEGFDCYRNTIETKFTMSVGESAKAIIALHGTDCDTYKLAQEYFRNKRTGKGYDADEWKKALAEEYLSMLNKDYEYQTSREQIEGSIRANEYEFTKDGSLF